MLLLSHAGGLVRGSYRALTRICHHQYDVLANSDVITIMIIM